MTRIITCSELRYHTPAELEALFRTLQIELGRTAPGSRERDIVLASLESVRRAMAARLNRQAEAVARRLKSALKPRHAAASSFSDGGTSGQV
jgi:hypothetical protein